MFHLSLFGSFDWLVSESGFVDPLIATMATQHAGLPFSHGGDELGTFLTCAVEHTALTSLLTWVG